MRIGIFTDTFPEISDTFILSQIVGLIRRGHEVHIHAVTPPGRADKVHADVCAYGLLDRTHYWTAMPGPKVARVLSAFERVSTWGWRYPPAILDSFNVIKYRRAALDLSRLHNLLPGEKTTCDYDVIHCHYGPNGKRALAMRKMGALRGPIITTFHGYDANGFVRVQGEGIYEKLFREGELFTVGSEFMKRRLISLGASGGRILKLPMGVDLSRIRFVERQKRESGGMGLLFVGRLVEMKGVEFLLKAMAIVNLSHPDITCVIAGDGPLRGKLEALAEDLGLRRTVKFLGAVSQDEALALYQAADAFVLASIVTVSGDVETQGVVLAEAQASGLPVIATRTGGIPESVLDGTSAFLVPPQNPEALAGAIIHLAECPGNWGKMGRAGRAYVEKKFNMEKLNDLLVDIYQGVQN